ncbi:retroviral-like aspartic protease family protein [uncultured Sphingomonas sp.]|uniref:retroviral-like aspartic protease family protein n=1 Tax=uncultured Sphingomonas sp. TaxID=158754 RepID=UPI0035CB5737
MESLTTLLAAAAAAVAAPALPPPAVPPRAPLDVALVQLVIAPPTPPPVPLSSEAMLALGTAQERMTVPVSIDQRGPWNFVIDTGAERTVVSRELAGVLGLASGPQVRVIAMTGPAEVGSVIVPRLSVSQISRETIEAPALGAVDMGAAGMLGLDALQGHTISIDFTRGQMTVKPARRRSSPTYVALPGEVVVQAKSLVGQLIVTDAFWHGKRISVIVDTGSPVTVGNGALLAAITRRPKLIGPMDMRSATGVTLHTTAFAVDRLDIGGIGFNDVRVAFSDVPPFRRFGLADTPALLLGMDALRLFRTVAIDFANREIRFALPHGADAPATDGLAGAGGRPGG